MIYLLYISILVCAYTVSYQIVSSIAKARIKTSERLEEMTEDYEKLRRKRELERQKASRVNIKVSDKFAQNMELSGVKIRNEEFILIWIFLALAPAAMSFVLTGSALRSLVAMLIGIIAPPAFISHKIKKRREDFEKQLGDALLIIANGLKAGFSFPQALNNVAKNMADPVSTEFKAAGREIALGVDIETALNAVADRMESNDLRLLTTAVVIQQQVGGNLSEILETISQTIRDRMKIKRSVKTLTAQGRISGNVIGGIPVFIIVFVSMSNPEYIDPLFSSTIGNILLGVSVFLELLGFAVIKKIVDIKL